MTDTRSRPGRLRPPRFGALGGVWALNAALVLAGIALWYWLDGRPAPVGDLRIPWWALAIGFAATDLCVVHIHFRRSAHSLTLGEIPLVLGLLFSAPSDVMLAWVAGAGLVVALQRGIPAVRVVFNVAQFGVSAGIAAVAFGAMAPSGGVDSPLTWAVAAAAALLSDAIASLLVSLAMKLSGERVTLRNIARAAVSGSFVSATNASLALAAAVVLAANPVAAGLLLVPAAAIFLAYRAYMAERAKHVRLEFLYDSARALTRAPSAESGLAGLLARGLETFRAELAEASIFPATEDDGGGVDVALGPDDRVIVREGGGAGAGAILAELVATRSEARLVRASELSGAAAEHFRARGIEQAMVAALPGDRRTVGALLMANRSGIGGDFAADELRLFETLAHHTGATLEQHRLGRAVSELRDIHRDLEHKAFHDPLTGLANRLLFMDRVEHALSRRGGNVGVLYIDLDDFKSINDTLGHEAGDELLEETARRLRGALRTADTPARLGGDEFAVLLVDISEDNARIVAERILAHLRESFTLRGRDVPVHASLGAALADGGAVNADQLVRNADIAMYVSKHGGKRGYTLYESGMELDASERQGRVGAAA